MFSHPHGKNCFFTFGGNLLHFSLCLPPLVLSLDTTEKNLASSSSHPPFRYLYTLTSPQTLLFFTLNHHGTLSLSSEGRYLSPQHINGNLLDLFYQGNILLTPECLPSAPPDSRFWDFSRSVLLLKREVKAAFRMVIPLPAHWGISLSAWRVKHNLVLATGTILWCYRLRSEVKIQWPQLPNS